MNFIIVLVSQAPKLITLVIPTLNEETGIRNTITKIPRQALIDMGYDLEILVVDGDSTDMTQHTAEQCGAKVIIETRRGYGRAVRSGFSVASGEIIAVCDGDGTYPVEYLPSFLQHLLDKNLDFLTIDRLSNKQKGAMHFSHLVGNKVLSLCMNLIYSISVKDSQSGMYLAKKSFLQLVTLTSENYSFAQEIKIIAFKFFRSDELSGNYYARDGNTKLSTWTDGLKNLISLFKFKRHLLDSLPQKERLKRANKVNAN